MDGCPRRRGENNQSLWGPTISHDARRRAEARPHTKLSYDALSFAAASEPAVASFRASTAIDRNDRDPAIINAVVRAQAGDMHAIDFLYSRYKDNVYGYVLSILRDEHEAEDVTQHVFMKLMAVIGKYEPRHVPFTSWILRVARNVAVDALRRRRAIPCEEVFEASHATEDPGWERRWGLEQALEALPQDQREVVMLRHMVGLTPGEIADHLDRTEASIHGLHHRARLALRRELESAECAPTTMVAA